MFLLYTACIIRILLFLSRHTFLKERSGSAGSLRVLDSESKGHGFETHWRYCVVALSKAFYLLLSTDSTKEADMAENC